MVRVCVAQLHCARGLFTHYVFGSCHCTHTHVSALLCPAVRTQVDVVSVLNRTAGSTNRRRVLASQPGQHTLKTVTSCPEAS